VLFPARRVASTSAPDDSRRSYATNYLCDSLVVWVVGQALQPDRDEGSEDGHDAAEEDDAAGTALSSGPDSSGRFSSLIRR
jgi:hypothetical protein